MRRFEDARVAAVFDSYSPAIRRKLLALRKLIFETPRKRMVWAFWKRR
jgi:hypothetical protein